MKRHHLSCGTLYGLIPLAAGFSWGLAGTAASPESELLVRAAVLILLITAMVLALGMRDVD